ncbi:MAG: hypothetical protein CMK76_13300 [Pseudomonadales bacterium]|nr:hypothetical protein [Pseudomonadales bacterium]
MAVRRGDALTKALGASQANRRFSIWLWFYLQDGNALFAQHEFGSAAMRDRMAEFINSTPGSRQEIVSASARFLLPDECLTWISNDDRQHQWLIRKILNMTQKAHEPAPTRLVGREHVVAMIDVWATDLSTKQDAVKALERDWNEHKKQDHIFRWFRDTDSAQRCTLAWEWLCKNDPILTAFSSVIGSYDELLKFFDSTSFSPDEKRLRVDAIKKRWSQQTYRKKQKGKKQYNFILSDKTARLLDELAKAHDLKRPQILEILIQMEATRGVYIAEKMEMLRKLSSPPTP